MSGALAAVALALVPASLGADRGPRVVVSIEGATLRLERGARKGRVVFPVSVGRLEGGEESTPLGTLYTGPDPGDTNLYIAKRTEPAFHRGLPALRLNLRRPSPPGVKHYPFGLHGPVTPTLIWGRASRGCVRMAAAHIRALYRFAARHPSMPVTVIRGMDRVDGAAVKPDRRPARVASCPEAAVGARRLRRITVGAKARDRICGGVDHWYALELQGGDKVRLELQHGSKLRAELYGIRAISTVARGRSGFSYRVPLARNNRGDRFVRVVAPRSQKRAAPYMLKVILGGAR